jgi:alkylhydroperoxidase family enzyme
MTFIQLPADHDADGQAAALFAADLERIGYVANLTRLFACRPAVYQAWRQLNEAIKASMDLRRHELATLAAARRLCSSYCPLAHGKVLRDRFYDAGTTYCGRRRPAQAERRLKWRSG